MHQKHLQHCGIFKNSYHVKHRQRVTASHLTGLSKSKLPSLQGSQVEGFQTHLLSQKFKWKRWELHLGHSAYKAGALWLSHNPSPCSNYKKLEAKEGERAGTSHQGMAGRRVPFSSTKWPPELRTQRWCSDIRACRAVVGLSLPFWLSAFFNGENSSSRSTSYTTNFLDGTEREAGLAGAKSQPGVGKKLRCHVE